MCFLCYVLLCFTLILNQVYWTATAGFGVRTIFLIKAGVYVCDYCGDALDSVEMDRRGRATSDHYMYIIFSVSESTLYKYWFLCYI